MRGNIIKNRLISFTFEKTPPISLRLELVTGHTENTRMVYLIVKLI